MRKENKVLLSFLVLCSLSVNVYSQILPTENYDQPLLEQHFTDDTDETGLFFDYGAGWSDDDLLPRDSYQSINDSEDEEKDSSLRNKALPSNRQLNIFRGVFNNRFTNGAVNTFRPVYNAIWPFVRNPEHNGLLPAFESCTSSLNQQNGVCTTAFACNRLGGKASGSCHFGVVCCIITISQCYATATLNNTYYQTTSIQPSSSCNLVIKVDKHLPEQKQSICQVRLDFLTFTIAQPSGTSQCSTDSFQASGALNQIPVICGDNGGQHMYLHIPPSDVQPSNLILTFKFGAVSTSRSWNIKISLLPCLATYLAPFDCLQYFTSSSGQISTFNWKDTTATMRILASQNYRICFRTSNVGNKIASSICFSQCTTTAVGAKAFSISANNGQSQPNTQACNVDYVSIPGGYNVADISQFNDRMCGEIFSPVASATVPSTVCTTAKPFELNYRTDSTQPAGNTNVGFCLNFQQNA